MADPKTPILARALATLYITCYISVDTCNETIKKPSLPADDAKMTSLS
jgi:hypothetical protein